MAIGDKEYRTEEVTTFVNAQAIALADDEGLVVLDEDNSAIIVDFFDGDLTYSVPVPSDGNVPGLIGQRSYRCVICALAFKEKDVSIFRGKPYGRPCGCYKDIKSILQEEREDRKRSYSQDRNYNNRNY